MAFYSSVALAFWWASWILVDHSPISLLNEGSEKFISNVQTWATTLLINLPSILKLGHKSLIDLTQPWLLATSDFLNCCLDSCSSASICWYNGGPLSIWSELKQAKGNFWQMMRWYLNVSVRSGAGAAWQTYECISCTRNPSWILDKRYISWSLRICVGHWREG